MNSPTDKKNNNIDGVNNSISDKKQPAFTDTSFGESKNLEKVREILFGQQIREQEKKFANLEALISQECASLREETKKRLDLLENYLKKEIETLSDRLKNEKVERDTSINNLAAEQRKIISSLESKFSQFDEQTNNSQRELREQVLNQSKNLQDEIQQKYEEILNLLQKESQDLRNEKIDNSHLASMFTELAFRLTNQQ
ncbi:MAG: hypothetical protein QNJ63_13585 [Calothrix sp. MO_192.B10]|nr:hypothetical protein [Calothrix sp. MO_192.B10]